MYYYIFESPISGVYRRAQRNVKELVGDTGIAGEMVSPSPARTVDELTQIGGSKGYTTVVAIGSDHFLNKVASSLLNQQKDPDHKLVFGVLPWNLERSFFSRLAGLQSLRQAIETLKFRKLVPISVGLVQPNKYFVSPIELKMSPKTTLRLTTKDFETNLQATQFKISKDLVITSLDENFIGSPLKRAIRWFVGKPNDNPSQSIFRHDSFRIDVSTPLPVVLEGETIAKTPISVTRSPRQLHLIVSRDKIST